MQKGGGVYPQFTLCFSWSWDTLKLNILPSSSSRKTREIHLATLSAKILPILRRLSLAATSPTKMSQMPYLEGKPLSLRQAGCAQSSLPSPR